MRSSAVALAYAVVLACAVACTPRGPDSLSVDMDLQPYSAGTVNLAEAVPRPWTRVCIFGPYSTNEVVQATLGFEWDSARVSDIARNDGITLLVFVGADDRVVAFANHPRGAGDFSKLSGQCHARRDAMFKPA